jgi:hypothetical protein
MSPKKLTPSPKLEGVPSAKKRSLASNINIAYNKTAGQRRLLNKASLTKSLVEDASEDFSNIEEHIGNFQNQIELQAEKLLG